MDPVQTEKIAGLILQLADSDGVIRTKAREELVEMGGPEVTQALVVELNDHRRSVRWEAAKGLISIADPIAAPALAHHLHDDDGDVRWLAAEGLSSLGLIGLQTTLTSAIHHASNPEFVRAVHHSLKEFRKHKVQTTVLDPVIKACEDSEPGVSLPVAAYKALEQIRAS